jgi:D-inositol-3-phosphate glycosyltransferase
MRIALMGDLDVPSAADRAATASPRASVLPLLERIIAAGHEVTLYRQTAGLPIGPAPAGLSASVATVVARSRPVPRLLRRRRADPPEVRAADALDRHWHYDQPELLLCQGERPNLPAAIACRRRGMPLARIGVDPQTLADEYACPGTRFDAVFVSWLDDAEQLVARGVPAHLVHAIPWLVDTRVFVADGAHEPVGTPPRLLLITEAEPSQAQPVVAWLASVLAETELVIADVSERPEAWAGARIRHWRRVLGPLAEQCQVRTPRMPALWPRTLRSADLLVSIDAGCRAGAAMLEGLACGVPAVAAAVGVLPEVVEHGVTGELVSGNDLGALAVAVRRLLDDPLRRLELGIAGAQRVAARHAAASAAGRLLATFERLLAQRPSLDGELPRTAAPRDAAVEPLATGTGD